MGFKDRFDMAKPWISLLVRFGMAAILIFAAIPKLTHIDESIRAVRAYRLLPEAVVPLVGTMLPVVELLLAVVLLLGLFTRLAAFVWLIMMAAFVFGVAWAWAKGYQIDCGCFGGGGDLAAGETAHYWGHMAERAGFVILGIWLAIFPKTPFSLDRWMSNEPEPADA